jgi:hypothetical protein
MKRFRPSRPSPALVVSIIALIVAMGGTGYAAVSLPKNSVGTKQLKKNAVIGSKIKKNSVTGSKVKNHSLTGADINLGALGTVPSATNASHANSADNAAHASSADNAAHATSADSAGNASTLGGKSASDFASAARGIAGYIVVDPSNGIVHSANYVNGGSYSITENVTGDTDQITFPFSVANRVAVVGTGSIDPLGGTSPCFTTMDGAGSDQVLITSQDAGGAACDEEYSILIF